MTFENIAALGGVVHGYRISPGYLGTTLQDLHSGGWVDLRRALPPATPREDQRWHPAFLAQHCWRLPALVEVLAAADAGATIGVLDLVRALAASREDPGAPPFPMPPAAAVKELLTPAQKHWRYFDYLGSVDEDVTGVLCLAAALATSPTGTMGEQALDALLVAQGWGGASLRAVKCLALARTDGNVMRNQARTWGMAPRWGDPPLNELSEVWALPEEPVALNTISHIKRLPPQRP